MSPSQPQAETPKQFSISVLGLGLMGSALARAFLNKGWKTTVWNRTAAKAQLLGADGGVHATTVDECIRASRLVVFCLLDQPAVTEILTACDANSCSSRVLIDFTSGLSSSVSQNQELAQTKSFSAYIRGAIETMPQFVGLPESIFYYSGKEKEYRAIEPALYALGTPVYLGADVSLASMQESILGTCFYIFSIGYLQSMTLLKSSKLYEQSGGAAKFTTESVIPLITETLPGFFLDVAKQIDTEDYVTKGQGVRLDTLANSLKGLIRQHDEQGVSSVIFEPMLRVIRARVAQGGEAEEMGALVQVLTDIS